MTVVGEPIHRTGPIRAALANGRLRRVLLAYLLFGIAEWASWITILVWAYSWGGVRGSSIAAVVQLAPAMVLAAGLAVRLGRLPAAVALRLGYAVQGLAWVACGLALAGDAPVPVALGLAAVGLVGVTMTRPVHLTAVAEAADSTAELTAGNAGSGWMESVSMFAGPILGGMLIGPVGPGGVVVAMGVASLAAAVLTLGLPSVPVHGRALVPEPAADLRDVLRDRRARDLSVLVAAEYVLVGLLDILLVVLAIRLLGMGESGPGVLNAMLGVGGALGAAGALRLVGRARLAPAILLASALAGGAVAAIAVVPRTAYAIVLIALAGTGKVVFDVSLRTQAHRLLPERMLTAAFGLQESTNMAGIAVGSVIAPALVALAGPRGALVVAGLVPPAIVLLRLTRLRHYDDVAHAPTEVVDLLKGPPALAILPVRALERLARGAGLVEVPAGLAVVTQGETAEHFYVIEDGRLDVTIDGRPIRTLGPGGWFGELALLREVPRTATVTAVTPVRLWTVSRSAFLAAVTGRSAQATDDYARDRYE